jgi:hypothetical protein
MLLTLAVDCYTHDHWALCLANLPPLQLRSILLPTRVESNPHLPSCGQLRLVRVELPWLPHLL